MTPQSLYLTQLAERLGPQALKNLGYSSGADLQNFGLHSNPASPQANFEPENTAVEP
ncbi:MAG TPA: hypothetical protein VNN22_21605 [Verrucomicrobiae bacterium]|nr:hypothetical protein [Verrucomicrobiae bacterium]